MGENVAFPEIRQRESCSNFRPEVDHRVDDGPPLLLPNLGVHRAVEGRRLDRGGAGPLTLGAVTSPKQGFLVLTVICKEGKGQ